MEKKKSQLQCEHRQSQRFENLTLCCGFSLFQNVMLVTHRTATKNKLCSCCNFETWHLSALATVHKQSHF